MALDAILPEHSAGPSPEGAPAKFDFSMLAKTEPGVTDDGIAPRRDGTARV